MSYHFGQVYISTLRKQNVKTNVYDFSLLNLLNKKIQLIQFLKNETQFQDKMHFQSNQIKYTNRQMHFFIQSKQKKSNQSSRQKLHVENEQPQSKVIKKIVVRKKQKQKLQDLNDEIFQVQSQSPFVGSNSKPKSASTFNQQLRDSHRMNPFGSFMAKEEMHNQQQQSVQNKSNQNYYLQSYGKNIQIGSIQKGPQQRQKTLARAKSKPIQPIKFEISNKLDRRMRKNSIQTDFQNFTRHINSYPTEIPSQKNSFQNYQEEYEQIDTPHLYGSYDLNNEVFPKPRVHNTRQIYDDDILPIRVPNRPLQRNNEYPNQYIYHEDQFNYEKNQMSQANELPLANHLLSPRNNPKPDTSRSQRSNNTKSAEIKQEQNIDSQQLGQQRKPYNGKYESYIQKQNDQLNHQRKRMMQLSDQANKVIANDDTLDFSNHHNNMDADTHFNALKHMIEQVVELFCIGEVIKYQLRYRSYEIITKIYAEASLYYESPIQLEEPIKVFTFALALKALLNEYQKSELDIIVNRLFYSSHELEYEEFFKQFQSILNSKQVSLFEPDSMKKQFDKTLEKAKRLFVIWIEIEYFTKKIKQILRNNKVVYDSILIECTNEEQPEKLDMELIQRFLFETSKKSHIKKLKVDIFFRHLIGNQLLKSKWTDWIHCQDVRVYNRYESKLMMHDKRQFKTHLNSKLNLSHKKIGRQTHDFGVKANQQSRKTRNFQSRRVFK